MTRKKRALALLAIVIGAYGLMMIVFYVTGAPSGMVHFISLMSMILLGASARELVPVIIRGRG